MRGGRPLVVALTALAVLATGCGGDSGKKSGDKTKTTTTRFPPPLPVNNKPLSEGQGACGLINRAEVSTAVGLNANAGTGVETGEGGSSCKWSFANSGSTPQFVSIIEVVKDAPAYEDRIRKSSAVETLAGVGDRAFLAKETAYVVKGPKLIILSVTTTQAAAVRKTATTKLAQSAAGRM